MKTIIERADHIHARVGTVQHAQVNNPLVDAPVEAELMQQWWQMIWTQRKKHGKKYVTLTPEYDRKFAYVKACQNLYSPHWKWRTPSLVILGG